ncbi:MAG: hypothetical protein JST83_05895, partial [Bacteroidetes bacterium]|nr:hypothetical protein [Bacteroidota bacterium]
MSARSTYHLISAALGLLLVLSVSSCRVSKKFTEGQTLLRANNVKFIQDKSLNERQKSHEDL